MSKIPALKGIQLASTGRSNGTSYTEAERQLATSIAATVLTATGHIQRADLATNEVNETVQAVAASLQAERGEISIPSLCRGAYRAIEAKRLTDDATTEDFPKVDKEGARAGRDHTSLGLLFRKACKEVGLSEEAIDTAFPSPYKAKKSA